MLQRSHARFCVVAVVATSTIVSTARASLAGPVDFGKRELNVALAARGLPRNSIVAELHFGAAESWSIARGRVVGGDERGLMYGLLQC